MEKDSVACPAGEECEEVKKRGLEDSEIVDLCTNNPYNRKQKRQRSSTTSQEHSDPVGLKERVPSRTVYLGCLPQGVTFREIFDVLRNGPIESVRLLTEKDCAFVDFCHEKDAEAFRQKYRGKRLSIRGIDIKVSYAKPSHLSEIVLLAQQFGATRNVYFSGITGAEDQEGYQQWERRLKDECERFGQIDMIKIVPERAIAFVHMASIAAAMEAVSWISGEPAWQGKRVNFGSDRSHPIPQERPALSSKPAQRTIYIGALPKGTTLEAVCDVVKGGLLDSVKILEEKSAAFATFIRPEDASSFYMHAQRCPVTVHECRVKISWASEKSLPVTTIHALQKGATRCILLENIDLRAFPIPVLTQDFSARFGEIESIWKGRSRDSSSVFVSFASIQTAVKAIDSLRHDRVFSGCVITFAKDRCSLPCPIAVAAPYVPYMPIHSQPYTSYHPPFPPPSYIPYYSLNQDQYDPNMPMYDPNIVSSIYYQSTTSTNPSNDDKLE